MIEQGDVYWVDFAVPRGSGPGYRHPCVVIQNDVFNASLIHTVVICVLTSNLRLAEAPGNVLLCQGEANLPKQCVANVSQVYTVDKSDLVEKIGSLPAQRVQQLLRGLVQMLEPRKVEDWSTCRARP